ncbi:MAG TPA: ABC transporter substrate binding protein [Microvirga sp.]|nr:ABC transporter substrate binding protein [Microvirga sp.]
MKVATLRLLLAALSLVLTISLPAAAKHRTGVHRIGVLWPVEYDRTLEAFRQEFRKLGYIEGETVALEYRSSRGNDALLPDLAAELVRLNVDLIVTWGVTAGRATRQATTTIPVVNGSTRRWRGRVRRHLLSCRI